MNIEIHLPKPHPNQQIVLDSKAKYKVILAGRRFGKSLIAQVISIERMLEGQRIAYVTPTFDLARNFFKEVVNLIPRQLIKTDNKSEFLIETINGGSLKFYSGESLSRFRGNKFHYCIIDEASDIPQLKDEFGSAILPTLIDYNGDLLMISTPKGKEFFYSCYQKGLNKEGGFESFHFTSYDNPFLSQEVLEGLKQNLTQFEIKQEILAIAGENADNPFGTDNINNNTITELSKEPTVCFGIDLAKYHDFTSITGVDIHGHMTYHDKFQAPWHITQQRIEQLPSDILKVVDATGVGSVIVEGLQLTCYNILPYVFTTQSKPILIYNLIKNVELGQVKFNKVTADEMHVFEYSYSSTGHISFGARSGYHDDSIISLALADFHRGQAIASANWKLHII